MKIGEISLAHVSVRLWMLMLYYTLKKELQLYEMRCDVMSCDRVGCPIIVDYCGAYCQKKWSNMSPLCVWWVGCRDSVWSTELEENEWDGMGLDWMELEGMWWDGMGSDGIRKDGMEWSGMEWDGMEWNGMVKSRSLYSSLPSYAHCSM